MANGVYQIQMVEFFFFFVAEEMKFKVCCEKCKAARQVKV